MTLIKRHRVVPLMKVQGGNASVTIPVLQRPCSFPFETSTVREIKLTLSKYWHSSAATIEAMQLAITDSHFVLAMANLGLKFLKLAWSL